MACCMPIGIAAAAGSAGLGMVLAPFRPYLLAASAVLLLFGLWELYREGRSCRRRSRTRLAVFWVSAAIVVAMMVAPQILANVLAGL